MSSFLDRVLTRSRVMEWKTSPIKILLSISLRVGCHSHPLTVLHTLKNLFVYICSVIPVVDQLISVTAMCL
jgi:hypothetical protein